MSKIGTLHTHFYLDGLFIVTYHSDKRIGLKSIDTGTMRYIDHRLFLSQYTALTTGISNTWAHTCYIHSIHIALAVLQFQHTPTRFIPVHTYCAHSITHLQHPWRTRNFVALATKLPFKALYSYLPRKGDGKVPTKKNPFRAKKLYITMKDQNGQKLTEKNFT